MEKICVETDKLRKVLENVKNGVSKINEKSRFTGIFMKVEENRLILMTTSGYNMFVDACEIIKGDKIEIITPIFRIAKNADVETIIYVDDDLIIFDFGEEKNTYKLIKDDFIDFKNFFKQEEGIEVTIKTKLLKEALKNEEKTVTLKISGYKNPMFINDKKLILPIVKREDAEKDAMERQIIGKLIGD